MSSTFVADTTDGHKSDNTRIIIVNKDGTVSVDQETLQNLIVNQGENTAVSVVRVGASTLGDDSSQDSNGTCDSQNDGIPHVNLTIDTSILPPAPIPQSSTVEGPNEPMVDPLFDLDPEQLERLECALQSEQAKQILGENVTAMLDILSLEEEKAHLTEAIRMDHCYTNLLPSSAPTNSSTPNRQYGPIESSDSDTSDNGFKQELHRQPVMISSTLAKQPARTRGRGRRPGRPRKDATAVHSLQSSRGGAARGSGHSTMKTTRGGQSVSSGMVMVQQIKHINSPLAPPPSSPSSASLVPLVKPLVMKSDRHSQHITSTLPGTAVNQGTVQKQITPVSGGGSRLVTLTGTKLGQVVAGGQQMQKNRTVPQQQQKLQIQQQQQGHQQEQKQQKQKQQMSTVTVRNYKEHKLPAQQDLDNKTACAHLPGRDESDELDSSEDESEEELVEDYFGSGEGLGRQCGRVGVKNRGSNHRPAKETSIRSFCSWDRDTDRYLGKVDVKGRGERGCGGPGRPEGVERAQHPKAKMPPVLEVMDWSRDRDSLMKSICNERVTVDRLGVSKIEEREHGRVTNLNSEIVTSVFRKRVVKTYMNVSGKSKLTLTKEMEGKVKEVINAKKIPEKTATSPNSEKKTAMKSPVREHSAELPQKPPAVTPPKPASNVTAEVDNRKNQNPKLENRKPSAHIAEAQSPALLSRSNILRRVSTGSEQKTPTSETSLVEAKKCVANQPASIKEMPEVNQGRPTPASCLAAELQSKQVFGSTKSNQRTTDEADTALQVPESRILHTEATKPKEQLLADAHLSQHSDGASTVETDNTHINKPMEAQPKKTVMCTSSQKQPETQVKERRKTDENKSSQTKGRSSSQSSKIDAKEMEDEDDEDSEEEDSEAESSDDESSDSEDDPDRLWCICQKPHNNRFMICCDSCEYWFHGKCVGITKKIGKQMEKKGVEWCCSKCTKKKEIEAKEKEQETKRQSKAVKEKEVMKIAPKETPHKEIQKYNEREIQEGNEREIQKNNEREIQKFNERDIQKDNEREMQRDNEREIQKNNEREIQKNNEREIQKDNERKIQKDNEREIQKNNEREIQKDNEREIQKNSKEEHHKSNIEETLTSPVQKQPSSSSGDGVTFCIVCKKEAQSTSIYCSDACILKHAQKFLSLINEEEPAPPVTSPTTAQTERNQTQALALDGQADHQMEQQSGPVSIQSSVGGAPLQKAKAEARVTVFERQTGTLLAGPNAPMTGNLKTWLKDNPTFEVVPPGVMPTTKFYNQEIAAQLKQPQNAKALEMQSQLVSIQPKPSPTQTEPVAIQSEPSSYAMIVMKSQVLPVAPQGQKPATDSARTVIVSQEVAASKPSAEVSHGVEPLAGTPKSVIKSTGNGTDAVHATKSVQGITVSKVTATSTIEENTVNKNQVPVITKKVEVKRSSSASSTETHKEEEEKEKPSGPQPIRINVRKTLQELLLARIQECNDLTVAEEDVKKIVLHIEEEMHSYFKDTGIKYKSKYRSLVFNIKDRKNLTLFRKIADKSVTPHQLVRLPPEALASQELAQWCEREAKRQLEIIENNGLDLTAPSKTHKGEKVIETNESVKTHVTESVDPSAVTALINSVSSTVEDSNLEQHKGETIHKGKGVKDREERREDKDHSSKDVDKSSKRDNGKKDVCDEEHSKKVKEGSRHESHHDNSRSDEHFKDKERSNHESRHDNSRSDEHFKDKERSSHESRHDNSRSDEHFKDKERSSHDNSRSDENSKDEERNRHESHHDNSRSDEHSKDKEGSRHESYDNSRSDEHFKDKERSSHESHHDNSRSDEHSKDKEGSRHESLHDNSRSDQDSRSKDRRKSSTKNIHHHHHRESSERDEDSSCRKECHDELRKGDIDSKEEDSKQIVKKVKVAVDNSFEEEEEEDDQKKSDVKVENKDKIKVDASSEVRAEDRDTCDREPSSTVIIKNPEVITIDDTSTMGTFDMDRGPRACVNVWKGFVNMPDVAKFFTTVQMVSGNSQNLCKDLPDTVDIVGRIIPETVWDYISKMKKSGTKEILVIRLTVANDEEKIPYIALYMYLNIRNRFGVVGNVSKMINFYIMPLASHNPVPQVLLPLDGPGFEDYRPHLLIGILVRTRRKRLVPQLTYAAKVPKRLPSLPVKLEAPERSSTPPLPGTIDDIGSVMPPHPPPNLSAYEGYTTPPQAPKHLSHGENMFHSTDPRLMRKTGHDIGRDTCVSEKRSELLQSENETTVIVPPNTAPKVNYTSVYNNGASCSPGGGVDDEIEILCEYNLHSTPKNSSNLQRKMEEFNNKIEEQKQQFKSIDNALVANNAIGGSAGPGVESLQVSTMMQSSMIKVEDEASKRLSSADVQNEDQNEAYIPTHSFTPNSDSVQWRDRPNDPTPSVPSALSSNLSSSSNLSKILASIKLNNSNSTTGSAKDNHLKEDSIVQNYTSGRSPNDMETMKTKTDCLRYMSQKAEIISPSSTSYLSSSVPIISASTSPFLSGSPRMNHSIPMTNLNSSSSVVPALLSLSTPVIHPVTAKTDLNVNRDSPQKPIDLTKSTTTLRLLSHDDLIKKVMAMELAASTAETQNSMTNPSLQEPYPPEVDHFPVLPMSAAPLPLMLAPAPPPPLSPAKLVLAPLKSLPSGQPLPSGLECEYPTYSSSYSPVPSSPQITVPSHTVQPLVSPSQIIPPPPSPQSVSYSVRHPTPVLYHMPPTHYSPPPTGYSIASPSHIGSPQGGSHTTSYVSTPVLYSGNISPKDREESEAMLRNKRKFQDMEDDISSLEKLESSSSGQGREHWDTKTPISMRGQFVSCNGMEPADRLSNCVVNSNYAPRTYLRSRGGRNGPPHRTRWVSQNSQDITNSEKKLSHCDASTCSQWDPHVKDFVEKQCERTGELKQKERENGRGRDVQVALGRTVMVQDVGDVDEVIMAVMIRHR